MNWVRAVLRSVVPTFGGVPVFCEDPDYLMEVPEVREDLRGSGVALTDWDGRADSLSQFRSILDDVKVLIVVRDSSLRHIVEMTLPDFSWCVVGLGHIFPKFNYDVVRSIPTRYWDQLYALHQEVRIPHNPLDSALLIARVIYGVDPLLLSCSTGWVKALAEVSCNEEGLPQPVAVAIHYYLCNTYGKAPDVGLLTQPEMAWAALKRELKGNPSIRAEVSSATELLLKAIIRERVAEGRRAGSGPMFSEVVAHDANIGDFLEFGIRYAAGVSLGTVAESHRLLVHRACVAWLRQNYHLALLSHNPAVLRLSSLVQVLDEEIGGHPLLLVVLDGMSLPTWFRVAQTWQAAGVIGESRTRAAFAIIPTVTTISRRAIFEGRLPNAFSPKPHSTRLERLLWQERFPLHGAYFSAKETQGVRDALALGKRRLCVVETAWDERCHRIMPEIDGLDAASVQWANRTGLRQIIGEALGHGYRVVLTADHGHVVCEGEGRPSVGDFIDTRSKRVIVFPSQALAQQHETKDRFVYKPPGLPVHFWPLFAGDFTSFDNPGILSVSHGSIGLEEVLVPVVEVHAP